ncbi:MAG TPA: transporter substrate-binding domain-containing protein [Alphaproteobacteria bacterium]|nr:transporter substrate-binding domain-containing protein [Alphaproteobacteria bacterium]
MAVRILFVCLSLISLAGCGEKKNTDGQDPIIVITSPDNPPFEFKDTAQGGDRVIGFDMDVVQKLGEHLGRPIKIVEADFPALIPSLQSGRADMAIAELAATEERRKSVDFSDPYFTNKYSLLVTEDSPLTSEKELNNQKLGAQLGSTPEALAHKLAKEIPGLSVISLNKIGDLVQELKSGRIQAVVIGDTTAHKIASTTPGVKVLVLNRPGGKAYIAFPKGSPLVAPTNEALKKMKGDLEKIAEKWMTQ